MRPGFVMVPRDELDDPLYGERPFGKWHAKIDLVLHAEHRDRVVLRDTQAISVKRGQVFTTQVELAMRWGWHRKTVRKFLQLLTRLEVITFWTAKDSRTGFTIVTILDYERYQSDSRVVRTVPIVGTIGRVENRPDLLGTSTGPRPALVPSLGPSDAHPMPTGKEEPQDSVQEEPPEEPGMWFLRRA